MDTIHREGHDLKQIIKECIRYKQEIEKIKQKITSVDEDIQKLTLLNSSEKQGTFSFSGLFDVLLPVFYILALFLFVVMWMTQLRDMSIETVSSSYIIPS
eukprot:TRINITY_DN8722_c0_g1_i1.p1 TRINITY_DN8722_c0_g1~~TRINITY_DN8722_c0_g1_i1.p1  ORF type:complete len:100 (-),score=18.14 TRINITY_DN8722_c0_g1_i1:54-353(-)